MKRTNKAASGREQRRTRRARVVDACRGGLDGPWKVIAIAPDANLDGGQRDLAAVASSMFRQVQAARDIDDVAELKRLVSDDLAASIELFGEDSEGCTRHAEIVGGPPEIRYVGRPGDGFASPSMHTCAIRGERAGVKLDRGRGTSELRERWTLARGPDHDWKVIAIADAQ